MANMNREQQKAMFAKQKFNLLKPHLTNYSEGSFGLFENLPVKTAEKLMTGFPNVDPKDVQNNSPTMIQMLKLAKENNGKIGGYIIPVDTNRDDSRITFTSVELRLDKQKAEQLRDKSSPDEFDKIGKDTFRFWWD